jgi:transcriptional regulator with XRE-family HTH domain
MPTEESGAIFDFSVLRTLRKRHSLTIASLSEQAGVSTAVISKLERNRTQAELDTLCRLAKVFGLQTTELIALAERRTSQLIKENSHNSDGFEFRQIRYGNVRCLLGSAPAGGWVSRPDAHSDQYELCWCLSGQVKLSLPAATHVLSAGEAVQFDAVLEHAYEAIEACRLLIIHLTKEKRF